MNISISGPTEERNVWYWEGIVLAALFGLGLILWPFMSFGAIFMFDSPIQSRSDEAGRYTVAFFIWGYPVTYVITLVAYYLLRRFGIGRVVSCLAWGLPVAIYFILSAYLTWQGRLIEGKGVSPNIPVELLPDNLLDGQDPQMQKAIEIVSSI